jgi:hypothetical protein
VGALNAGKLVGRMTARVLGAFPFLERKRKKLDGVLAMWSSTPLYLGGKG